MESKSFHFPFIVSPSFSKQPSFFSCQSKVPREKGKCILKEAFKVEYSSKKNEGELRLDWVRLNVHNLAEPNAEERNEADYNAHPSHNSGEFIGFH